MRLPECNLRDQRRPSRALRPRIPLGIGFGLSFFSTGTSAATGPSVVVAVSSAAAAITRATRRSVDSASVKVHNPRLYN